MKPFRHLFEGNVWLGHDRALMLLISTAGALFITLDLLHGAFARSPQQPSVVTPLGVINGVALDLQHVYGYFGIPYAEAPVNKLRFRPAQKKQPWFTPLNATTCGHMCPQLDPDNKPQGSEDW